MTIETRYNPGDRVEARLPWRGGEVDAKILDLDLRVRGGGRKITVLYVISYTADSGREIVETVRGEYIRGRVRL